MKHIVTTLAGLSLIALAALCAQDLTITNARVIAANGAVIEYGSIVVRLSGGGPAEGNITLRDHIEKGLINGPRIIPSGQVRLKDNTPEMARAQIKQMAGMGIKFTGKIGLTPEPGPTQQEIEVLRAIVDEAKKDGVLVQVHAVSSIAITAAIDAGVRLLVYLPNKDWVSKEAAQKLAATGTKILGTIGSRDRSSFRRG